MDEALINELLANLRRVAVVGWSTNPERPAHWIANELEQRGLEVYRINPRAAASEPGVLAALADLPQPVDLIDIFRAPAAVPAVVEEAIAIGAPAVWLQPGAENDHAVALAKAAGIKVVHGHCLYAELKQRLEEN